MADTRLYELEECVSPQADDILLIEESATQTDKKVKLSELMPTDAVESAVADWLTAHPEATTTVEDGSITPVKLATSTMDLFDEKADTVGEYDDMTVGNAKQLLSKGYTENKTPYIYRKSAGGDRVYEKLIGGTIAWNQLCPIRSDFSGNGITLTNNSDGSYNINGTAEAVMNIPFGATFTVYQNHKYYIKGCPSDGGSNKYYFGLAGYVSEIGSGAIFNYPSATSKQNARLDIKSGANISNAKIIPQVIDLTQMFGTTIADYIYSLEQATAGAGVAWFRQMFPRDYYAYDSGSLQSVNVASKKVYDSNNTLVATYTFDSDVTLRGLPKLDSNNNLYYDGDVYESNGTVTRRYGIVDLGSLNWAKFLDQVGVFTSTSDVDNMYVSGSGAVEVPIKCGKYVSGLSANELFDDDNLNNSIAANGVYPRFIVRDTSKNSLNPTEFAAAMVGVYVLYPLATQTSENADSFINPQIVDADGTEEFVDYMQSQSTRDVAVPVGHESKYMINLRAKIEDAVMLPTLPTTNGTYTLKCIVASGTPTLSWVAN